MKYFLLIFVSILSTSLYSQNEYIFEIDDKTLEISLDEEYTISLGGKDYSFKLIEKDTLIYNSNLFSFEHSKDYKVSKLVIEEGVEQIMIISAEGTGMLIQEYSTMNPTMLNEMMLSEITKESLNYGFDLKRKDYSRKLKSGKKLEVKKAILTYKDEVNIYEVASIGQKDEGILIVTMIMDEKMSEEGRKIINLMWSSLMYK